MDYEIREYGPYEPDQILPLYAAVGWTAYTDRPDTLEKGFAHSLLTLAAYDGPRLLGVIRAVGDGHTIVLVQDILVYPNVQRKGIGAGLLQAMVERFSHVRQIQLATDDTPKTTAFYRSQGFLPMEELGCRGFMRA